MATMKAIQWVASRDRVELIDAPMPSRPAPKHVIVKVAYSGICGTDLHIMKKEFAAAEKVIMGHEMSGTISEVGEGVSTFKVGDKIAVDPNRSCGECRFCVRNQVNYCVNDSLRTTVGFFRNGGWAEYVEIPAVQAVMLPPGLSLKQGVLCEPLACITRGWDNNGLVPDDSNILILGSGIIGLLWQCLFHHHGYRNITVTEVAHGRQKLAEGLHLGYKRCHPDEVKCKMAKVLPEVDGYDLIVDTTGNEKAIEEAFPWLRRGGSLNVFGCCPKKSTMTVNPAEFMLREVSIRGSLIAPSFNFPKTTQLVANMADKYLDYDKLGIREFVLEDFQEAIMELKNGNISKAVFKISEE